MKLHTAQTAICIFTLIPSVLAGGYDACQKQYLRFTSVPTYDNDAGDPCSCQESYHNATWKAIPRYTDDGVIQHGTSPGVVMYNTKQGENGTWSTDTKLTWTKNDYGSKVTWENGHKRTGAGETNYKFTAPATSISYSLMFTTHNLMVLEDKSKVIDYILKGGHVDSNTQAGGYGISVYTWQITTPQMNDPIGTMRAMYLNNHFGVFKRHATNNHSTDWNLEYVLPKSL